VSLPALFIGHGSPMLAIEPGPYTAAWAQLARELPRPRAILVISAHWYTQGLGVTAMGAPRTIHDFYGFPPALYALQYPAPGDPPLAARLATLLAPQPLVLDQEWGLDHGTWAVLRYMYPAADIPVLQLSLDATREPQAHFALAQQLAPLRAEGILVLGSGNVVHNLRLMSRSQGAAAPAWASEFNAAVRSALVNNARQALIDYPALPGAQLAVPTPEHYLPLLYALALQAHAEPISIPIDGLEYGAISMMCIKVG
jgi:4,5-DOPA dioxygenase extradiol